MASTSTQTIELPEPEQAEKTAPVTETKPSDFVIKISGMIPF